MVSRKPVSTSTVAVGAAVLALGVASLELVLHRSRGVLTGAFLPHLLLDASLMFPLAILAIVLSRRLSPTNAGIRHLAVATVLTLTMVPSVGLHSAIHKLIEGPTQEHLHTQFSETIAHGLQDSLPAFPLIVMLGFALDLFIRKRATGNLKRRSWIPRAALALVLLVPPNAQALGPSITPFAVPMPIPPTLTDTNITLTAAESNIAVLPGNTTKMWTFNGTFPGPTIRRPSGQPTNVTVVNALPASAGEITLHHHGSHSTSIDDGQPHEQLIATGGSRPYNYDLMEDSLPERGALQWYHDHRMDKTGRNVWMGLAGMVILDDPAEAAINAALPNGQFDVPMMMVDRKFDVNNQIPYNFLGDGVMGDAILVNGAPQPYFEVADRKYRLRLLNASNARSFTLAFSDSRPFVQVGAESGLFPAPVTRTNIQLGPAERADVVVDFAGAGGSSIVLRNLDGFGPTSQVMQFRVNGHVADPSFVPSVLRTQPPIEDGPVATNRAWILGRDLDSGMWTFNGQGFDHNRIDAKPTLGTTERWTFVNSTSVDHIVHIHDVDWRIVLRSGGIPLKPGLLADESGMKESFRLRGNETVTVISRFTDHLGKYVLHCHMLEHEDFAMMAQFEVVSPAS
ncbi:MAG: multicopper oxidase family protein [Actinomycetota bacterium]